MDDLQAEKSKVSKELETERKELESAQNAVQQQMDALNRLREKKNRYCNYPYVFHKIYSYCLFSV